MENLSTRLFDLYNSLGEFKAADHPSDSIVPVYNVLVDAAKESLGDDPIVQAVPHTESRGPVCTDNAGALRSNVWQILSAMGETGPSIG